MYIYVLPNNCIEFYLHLFYLFDLLDLNKSEDYNTVYSTATMRVT